MLQPDVAETDDLRASIAAQFETEAPAAENPAPEVEAPEAEAVVNEQPEAEIIEPKGDHPTDPLRYADGTFKPTKTEAAPKEAAPDKVSPSKDDQTKASEVAAQTVTHAPPAGWTAAEKAEWQKLPPAVQAAVSRRESEIANGGRQWSEEKRRYETLIAPVAEASGRRGLDVGQGIQMLIAAQNALDANPIEGIKRIAATYGVDLATLAGQAPADGSREAQQPDIEALVRRAVQPMLAPIQDRYAREETQRQQSTVDLVTTFATSPGHEHFDAVQAELMAMIPTIKAANPTWTHEKVLQDAYDRAVYANPTTRSAVLAAQQQEADAKRQADARARADKARRAASSVTGAPSGSPSTQAQDSLRAEIEAAFTG
jgi:hypothetical protein